MGGQSFRTKSFAETPEEAFRRAVREAERRKGTDPYSGTVSEKKEFVVIPDEEVKGKDRERYAETLISERDERIDSFSDPAGAISLKGTKAASEYREANGREGEHGTVWLFFGTAMC